MLHVTISNEGSFVITPYDEDGATAVAVHRWCSPRTVSAAVSLLRPLLIKKRNPRLDRGETVLEPMPMWD